MKERETDGGGKSNHVLTKKPAKTGDVFDCITSITVSYHSSRYRNIVLTCLITYSSNWFGVESDFCYHPRGLRIIPYFTSVSQLLRVITVLRHRFKGNCNWLLRTQVVPVPQLMSLFRAQHTIKYPVADTEAPSLFLYMSKTTFCVSSPDVFF
jgi:hypothetical protein